MSKFHEATAHDDTKSDEYSGEKEKLERSPPPEEAIPVSVHGVFFFRFSC